MAKKAISVSHKMNGILDDDYTLYDNGSVLHFYDKHTYPGGQNINDNLFWDRIPCSLNVNGIPFVFERVLYGHYNHL